MICTDPVIVFLDVFKVKGCEGCHSKYCQQGVYKNGNYQIFPTLKDDAVKVFDADLETIDFNKSAEAAHFIKKWVESKTNNKIKNLISPDSFNSDSRLVIVNAIYFKGSWTKKFNPQLTTNQPFFVKNDVTIDVPMMYKETNYKYKESQHLQAKLLEMFYEGEQASMLIVLPDETEGLDGVLQKLANGYDLMGELGKMYSRKVQLTLPKFKVETQINLLHLLPKLGVTSIFDTTNSGLTKLLDNNEKLFVSTAVQKAFIEVNEEGAEAAAATGFVERFLSRPPRFVADHPFLAIILINRIPFFLVTHRGTQ